MPEKTIQAATYATTDEALAARLRLESEGIACALSEESPSPADVSISAGGRRPDPPVRGGVAGERAAEVLAANEPLELDEDWQAQAEGGRARLDLPQLRYGK